MTKRQHGLSDATRLRLAKHWEERALCELRVAGFFSTLAADLLAVGASSQVIDLVSKAPHDEVRHTHICIEVAEHYRKTEVPWPPPGAAPIGAMKGVAPELVPTLHVVTHCCINETIAGAWLEACHAMATATVPRRALRALLADEIDHARIGWAHLASRNVTKMMRRALAKWLPLLVADNLRTWLRVDPVPPARGVPPHGIPSQAFNRKLVHAAMRELVLPGFVAVGVDVSAVTT